MSRFRAVGRACGRSSTRIVAHALAFALAYALTFALLACAGCSKHSTDTNRDGPPSGTRILWTYAVSPGTYYVSPALSADEGTVYFGTSRWLLAPPAQGHSLIALRVADGSLAWRCELGWCQVRSAPAVGTDGSIYFAVEDFDPASEATDLLYRLSSAGEFLWGYDINPTHVTSEVGLSAPAIGADGTVYVAGDRLYAIHPDGTLKWTAFEPTYEARRNSPVIGPDGIVYFVYHNIPLTALDPETGQAIWSCPLGVNDHCFASPAIGADGTIYACTQPGIVYAVSSAGQIEWEFDIASAGYHGFLRSSPAVDADGSIYFGLNNGSPSSALFALAADGSLRWIFEPGDLPADVPRDHFDIYSSPAIGSDGTIYFGQEFGRVYAIDPANGSLLWMQPTSSGITWSSPVLTSGGVLCINDLDGHCLAIRTESRGLKAAAPWPKYRFDNWNTGWRRE